MTLTKFKKIDKTMDKNIEEQVDQIAFLVKRLEETTERALKILKCIEDRVALDEEELPNKLVQ